MRFPVMQRVSSGQSGPSLTPPSRLGVIVTSLARGQPGCLWEASVRAETCPHGAEAALGSLCGRWPREVLFGREVILGAWVLELFLRG